MGGIKGALEASAYVRPDTSTKPRRKVSMRCCIGVELLLLLMSFMNLGARDITGSILGRFTCKAGGMVPVATVKIENTETGSSRPLETDRKGRYVVRSLPLVHC